MLTDPTAALDNRRQDLDHRLQRLLAAQSSILAGKKQRFAGLAGKLDAMSPLRVLSRGYTVATDERGALLRSAAALRAGDRLKLRFADGAADCRVEGVTKEEDHG